MPLPAIILANDAEGQNETLLRYGFINHYQNGTPAEALQLAREFERLDFDFGLAAEPAIAKAVQDADWQALIALSEKIEISDDFHLLAGGLRSLAYLDWGAGNCFGHFHSWKILSLSRNKTARPLWLLGGAIFEYWGKQDGFSYARHWLKARMNMSLARWRQVMAIGRAGGYRKIMAKTPSADSAPLKLIEQMNGANSAPPARTGRNGGPLLFEKAGCPKIAITAIC